MSRVNFVKNNNALFWIFITNSIIVLPSTEALYKSAKTLFSIDYIYIYNSRWFTENYANCVHKMC